MIGAVEQYGGTHYIAVLNLALCQVDLKKRTAFVTNGCWDIEWDDTDVYCRRNGFLEWLCEVPDGFKVEEVEHGQT